MRLIPDVLLHSTSQAESKVFEILRDVALGPDWTAYHSLNCSEHAYKHWAEIDFLVVGPKAVLVLEIKGGRVQCRDGIWTYTDRFGRQRTNSEGPYGQARSAMYALRAMLADRYKLRAVSSKNVPFGFGVLFPDVDWDLDTPECPAAITADRMMLQTATSASRYLDDLVSYWLNKHRRGSELNHADLQELRSKLRPDVDVYPSLSLRLGQTLTEMQQLTEEQYERLESLELNDRAIVTGGAGTGKTFLLVQFARRSAARGKRVLIVVHSPTLAAHLKSSITDPDVTVVSFESVRRSPVQEYDILLVDEGQDLMNMDALAELARRLKGGLDAGRWAWFLDENNQAGISGAFDDQTFRYLQEGLATGKPVRLPLRLNCRNTKEIVRQVQLWTGADIGIAQVSGFGTRPELVVVTDLATVTSELSTRIGRVLDAGAQPGEIGIITGEEKEPACFRDLPTRIKRLLTPLDVATVSADLHARILWGSPSRFKGLERPIIFVLAESWEGQEWRPWLYVSATRANYGLYVFAQISMAARLATEYQRHAKRLQQEAQ